MKNKRIYIIVIAAIVISVAAITLFIVKNSSVTLSVTGMPDVIVSGKA